MEEKKVSFQFNARYYKTGILNNSTSQVWIVIHGYGQLAQYFIKKFQKLTEKDICILAPEGLSRFYLSDLTQQGRPDNKVGATWMTRENRLMDIDNYLEYLDHVYETELKSFPNVKVTLLGFSQGCATVCRWAAHGNIKFEKLILWAGLFPPDMNFDAGHKALTSKKTYMVVGDEDHFVTLERIAEFDTLAAKLNIQPEKITFKGKHEINEEILLQLI
ncbi:MAG: alpha/beta hydrolase [Cyclobacteriaceae bacterium]|nr:alpha/beta hydrolase [Cyclobacteriaceae bacterium]